MNLFEKMRNEKQRELAQLMRVKPIAALEKEITMAAPLNDFYAAINTAIQTKEIAIIAQMHRGSPGEGIIRGRENFPVANLAEALTAAGADALAIINNPLFYGKYEYLEKLRKHTMLPILCKDYFMSRYQVYHARALGADCILMNVAASTDAELAEVNSAVNDLQMQGLIMFNDIEQLPRALKFGYPVLAFDQVNLKTGKLNKDNIKAVVQALPKDNILIAASGIKERQDIERIYQYGVKAFLIGSTLMQAEHPGMKLKQLLEK